MQPQKKTSQLIERLDHMSSNNQCNEFELASIKKEVKRLDNTAHKFMLLGMVAELEHDTKAVIAHFDNAIRFSPNDFHVNANYAVMLGNMGRYIQAMPYARKALELVDNQDSIVITQACLTAYRAGLIREAKAYADRLAKLGDLTKDKANQLVFLSISHCLTVMDEYKLKDKDVETFFAAFVDVLIEYDVYPDSTTQMALLNDEEGMQFVRTLEVDASYEQAAEMNMALAEKEADLNVSSDCLAAFCFSFQGVREDKAEVDAS